MEWKIFYSKGTYSSVDGPPDLAPKRDVQAIAVADSCVGRRVERQNDYYIWSPPQGGWRGVDQFGLFDYLVEPGAKIVLFGRTLTNNEYRAIWDLAVNDPDLPPKSAYEPDERRGGTL